MINHEGSETINLINEEGESFFIKEKTKSVIVAGMIFALKESKFSNRIIVKKSLNVCLISFKTVEIIYNETRSF